MSIFSNPLKAFKGTIETIEKTVSNAFDTLAHVAHVVVHDVAVVIKDSVHVVTDISKITKDVLTLDFSSAQKDLSALISDGGHTLSAVTSSFKDVYTAIMHHPIKVAGTIAIIPAATTDAEKNFVKAIVTDEIHNIATSKVGTQIDPMIVGEAQIADSFKALLPSPNGNVLLQIEESLLSIVNQQVANGGQMTSSLINTAQLIEQYDVQIVGSPSLLLHDSVLV